MQELMLTIGIRNTGSHGGVPAASFQGGC